METYDNYYKDYKSLDKSDAFGGMPQWNKPKDLSDEARDGTSFRQNNYFTSMLKRYGREDFLYFLKPDQIQKSAKERIFREMVQGRIDYSIFGTYFQDPKFIGNLLVSAENELKNNTVILRALTYYERDYSDSDVLYLRSKYTSLVYVYQYLVNKIRETKLSGNVGCLTDMQYVLGEYRNLL